MQQKKKKKKKKRWHISESYAVESIYPNKTTEKLIYSLKDS